MTRQEIQERVNRFLVEDFEIDAELLTEDALLHETLEIDSLDFVDIAVAVHSEFGFKPASAALKELKTLGDFYSWIESQLPA